MPVRIEDVPPTESLAYFMSTVHWLDALTPPIEAHLQRLAELIKGLLQLSAPGVTQAGASPGSHAQPPAAVAASTAAAAAPRARPGIRSMFAELMNFSHRRNWLQAIGWYLIFLIGGIVIGGVIGRMAGIAATSFSEGYDIGNKAGQLSAIPYHIALATLLVWNRPKDAPNILLAFAGVAISALLGALGGLIPLAVLSTRPSMKP